MKKSTQAAETFKSGSNCAQSVFSVFGTEAGIDRETCMKIAAPFGGGFGKNQKVCGAVTGALMALGLKYGKGSNETAEDKKQTYEITNRFIKAFSEKHGSIDCLDILGADMHTEDGMKKIKEENLMGTKCVQFVEDAVKMAEKLM